MNLFADARHVQLAILAALVTYGLADLDLEVRADTAVTLITVALAVQLLATRIWKLPRFDPRSALISSLSLCLLLRTGSLPLAGLAAVIAILSKFVLRAAGRHLFNPSAFTLVSLMALTDGVWVSPGQWGSGAIFAFLTAAAGGLVLHRATTSDVTLALILFYAGIVFARALWLGDPMALPLHHLRNGAFVLFSFFMISDPKTTPDSRAGRLVFAALVATGAAYVHFVLFEPNGLLWSLVLAAPTVPLLNRWFPGVRFEWRPRLAVPGQLSERSFA